MPCRGRPDQTIRNVQRLLATAGAADWQLFLVGTEADVAPFGSQFDPARVSVIGVQAERLTYWQALQFVTDRTEAPLLANLANDLIPGQHWLARAVAAYDETFPEEQDYGMLGFNGDSHGLEHSCHFLIDRDLLTYLGGWPVWYDHAFGDTELCQRTIALGRYAKAPWALLFHDHPYFGGVDDDVYAEGRANASYDERLFLQRRASAWPTI